MVSLQLLGVITDYYLWSGLGQNEYDCSQKETPADDSQAVKKYLLLISEIRNFLEDNRYPKISQLREAECTEERDSYGVGVQTEYVLVRGKHDKQISSII